jgi:hypothetical protein
MPAASMHHLRAAVTAALIVLSCRAIAQDIDGGIHYGVAPALDCKGTSKPAVKGKWIEADGVSVRFAATRHLILSFGGGIATDAIHAAMNGAGLRTLALVEVQGTDGAWHKVWEGQPGAPEANFSDTCFEQQLPRKQVVQALRFSFRAGPDRIEASHGAVLRR